MTLLNSLRRSPQSVYLFITGADKIIGSLFATVQMVYFATDVTQDPFQLVFIWTVFQASVFLFEIPTGVVADVYSRRLSVILAFLVTGVGAILVGATPVYLLVLGGMVILGLGDSFLSGALDAWIADEIGEDRVGPVYMRRSQVAQVAILAGIPLGAALGSVALRVPILLAGALYLVLGLILWLIMPEEGFQPVPAAERHSWRTLFATFLQGVRLVRGRPVLVTMMSISAIAGISAAGFDSLWTAHMLENIGFPSISSFEPVVWIAAIQATVAVISLIGIEIVRRRLDSSSQRAIIGMLLAMTGVSTLGMIAFGLVDGFWLAAAVYCLSYSLRIASSPLFLAWMNLNVDSNVRATVLSMDNQVTYLGRLAGGPIVGAVGSAVSISAALVVTGLARLPIVGLLARVLGKGERGLVIER